MDFIENKQKSVSFNNAQVGSKVTKIEDRDKVWYKDVPRKLSHHNSLLLLLKCLIPLMTIII